MSPVQVKDALVSLGHGKLIADKDKASGFTTGKDKLKEIAHKVPLAERVLAYRTNKKILSTYLENAEGNLDEDGRVRHSWNLHGTESGRLSCPFLHQIPRVDAKRRKRGLRNLRDMFIVPSGFKYVYMDYSQIELRVLAILAGDETMLEMYRTGKDLHIATAGAMLGIPIEKVSDFNRQEIGKVTNFGLAYGSKGYSVVANCQYEDEKGKRLPITWDMFNRGMREFKKLYPQLSEYLDNVPDLARMAMGTLKTPFGRERRFGTRLNDGAQFKREAAEREAVNFTIQSTAGAITLRTITLMDSHLSALELAGQLHEDHIVLINTVHDSIAYKVKDELVDWFLPVLKENAERAFPELENHTFPCKIGVGDSWTEAECGPI